MRAPVEPRRLISRLASIVTGLALATVLATTASAIDPTKPVIKQPQDPGAPGTVQPSFSAGSQVASALSSNATGIYSLGTSSFGGYGSATTFALIHAGQIKQVHSKSGGNWMIKQAGSSGGMALSGPKFDQLMQIAGGGNRNVNTLPQATRTAFLCAASLQTTNCAAPTGSGPGSNPGPGPGGSWPPEIAPTNGTCPTGYGLKSKPGTKVLVCQLLTHQIDRRREPDSPLLAALELLIGAAEARDCGPIGCLSYFSFGEISAFRFRFEYNDQSGFWGFNGFGIVAIFMLPEPGGG